MDGMNERLIPVLALLALLLSSMGAGAASPRASARGHASGESQASEFELKDQYENALSYKFPRQKPSVLTFGDRKGSEQIEGWVRPLYDRYQERIDQHGVAVLSSVPSFMRGVVRRIFKSQVKYSVLLDWKGDVSRSYEYQGGKANVVVIDRNGQIVLRVYGAANQQELNRVYTQIDKLL